MYMATKAPTQGGAGAEQRQRSYVFDAGQPFRPVERLGCRLPWHCERYERDVDRYREATLRPRVRGERGVVGDGDGADDGQSEAVVVVDAGAVESLEGVEEAVDLLGRDHRP